MGRPGSAKLVSVLVRRSVVIAPCRADKLGSQTCLAIHVHNALRSRKCRASSGHRSSFCAGSQRVCVSPLPDAMWKE